MNNIGYDIEGFLSNKRGFIPAERVLAGTKGRGSSVGPGVLAHPDNVMAEFSCAAPFDSSNLHERITRDVGLLAAHVAPVSFSLVPSIVLSEEVLAESELASEVGCEPDHQYGQLRNPIDAGVLGTRRYAGGHIHFDLNRGLPAEYAALVADVLLAVPLIAYGEQQGGRRAVYGLPGLNRPKPYGFEYRTLSNYWAKLVIDEKSVGRTFCRLVDILANAYVNLDDDILQLGMIYGDYAKDIISSENQGEANNLLHTLSQRLKLQE